MLMYAVLRNPTYDKYYLTTRQGFDHLMDCLYDTEKWANVLVRVSWYFEWGPVDSLLDFPYRTRHGAAMERPYNIPLLRRFLGSGEVLGRVFLFLFAEFFYVILVFEFFFCLALLLRIHTFTFMLTASRRTRAFTSPGGGITCSPFSGVQTGTHQPYSATCQHTTASFQGRTRERW